MSEVGVNLLARLANYTVLRVYHKSHDDRWIRFLKLCDGAGDIISHARARSKITLRTFPVSKRSNNFFFSIVIYTVSLILYINT